jgi:hypothetical protein
MADTGGALHTRATGARPGHAPGEEADHKAKG